MNLLNFVFILFYVSLAKSLKCFERYKFLDPIDVGPNDETKEVNCPQSSTSCGDALVSFQDPSGNAMTLNVKFCGGNSNIVTNNNVTNNVTQTTPSKRNSASGTGKAADEAARTALQIEVESDQSLISAESNNSQVVIKSGEFCEGINATAVKEGWTDVSCVETRCVADLCNGLKCYQPKHDCVKNLTQKGASEVTLGNVAGCASETRQCDVLDVSACFSVDIRTRARAVSLRGCHSKGEKTFCQRLLARAGRDEVDCREIFCVTNDCNKPEVVTMGIIVIVAGAFLGVAVIIIIILVGRICCCEPSREGKAKKNKNMNRESSSFSLLRGKEKKKEEKQKGKHKGKQKEKQKGKNDGSSAEKSYSALSLVRRYDLSRTKDREDSSFEMSDFDS